MKCRLILMSASKRSQRVYVLPARQQPSCLRNLHAINIGPANVFSGRLSITYLSPAA